MKLKREKIQNGMRVLGVITRGRRLLIHPTILIEDDYNERGKPATGIQSAHYEEVYSNKTRMRIERAGERRVHGAASKGQKKTESGWSALDELGSIPGRYTTAKSNLWKPQGGGG